MKKNLVLANDKKFGQIQRCPHGVVHVHYRAISLRLTEEDFFKFASTIDEALSRLMQENLSELFCEDG